MTFIKPQRQAAPWSQHNFWGQFDNVANLPNRPNSDIQVSSTELQEGDVAWAAVPGALFVCTDPTAGASVWEALSMATPSTATALELWVDGDNGNDANDGTEAAPLQTVDAALDLVPTLLDRDYVIHIQDAPIQGPYPAPSLEREFFCGDFRLALVGEAFTVVDSGTLTGFTNTGANPWLLTDNTQAWAVDEHIVRFLRLTSGAAAGSILNVIENDATTIRTAGAVVNAAIGDTYEIVLPAVTLNGFNHIGGAAEGPGGTAIFSSSPVSFPLDSGGVLFVNLSLDPTSLIMAGSAIRCAGVFFTSGAVVARDVRSGLPEDLTFLDAADVIQNAQGAGIILAQGNGLRIQGQFSGVLNADSITSFINDGAAYAQITELLAGRIWGGGAAGCISLRHARTMILGVVSTTADNVGRLLLRDGLGVTPPYGLRLQFGGFAVLEDSVRIECQSAGSVGIECRGVAGHVCLQGAPAVDGDARGIRAVGGGRVQFHGNGAAITTAGSTTASVEANGAAAADTGPAGAFTTDLDTLAGTDGSLINRVDD